MSNFDSREEHLRRDLSIDWSNEPAAAEAEDNTFDFSENGRIAYNVAINEARMRAVEAEKDREDQFAGMNAEQIKAAWKIEAAKEAAKTLPARQIDAVSRFVQATPELVLNRNNQELIDQYLKLKNYDATDPSHFDEAYQALSRKNLLDINESKRQREPWQRGYSESDLYAMPMDELEARARGQR
jgi:hypothetical protein